MARLHMAVGLRGDSTPSQWAQVAAVVGGGRTPAECEAAWSIVQDRFTAKGSWIGFSPSRKSLGLPPEQEREEKNEETVHGRAARDQLIKKALRRDCNHKLRPADKMKIYAAHNVLRALFCLSVLFCATAILLPRSIGISSAHHSAFFVCRGSGIATAAAQKTQLADCFTAVCVAITICASSA